jgi:DNA-binding PadR family transcriptional regulator
MDPKKKILRQFKSGTTEILILAALSQEDSYGYDLSQEVKRRSKGFFEFRLAFLYPTLQRLEAEGLVTGYWRDSVSGGPDRKYYRLTRLGRRRLEASLEAWTEFSKRFDRILAPARQKDLVRLAAS